MDKCTRTITLSFKRDHHIFSVKSDSIFRRNFRGIRRIFIQTITTSRTTYYEFQPDVVSGANKTATTTIKGF